MTMCLLTSVHVPPGSTSAFRPALDQGGKQAGDGRAVSQLVTLWRRSSSQHYARILNMSDATLSLQQDGTNADNRHKGEMLYSARCGWVRMRSFEPFLALFVGASARNSCPKGLHPAWHSARPTMPSWKLQHLGHRLSRAVTSLTPSMPVCVHAVAVRASLRPLGSIAEVK